MKKVIIIIMLFIGGITLSGCFDIDGIEPGPQLWYSFGSLYQSDTDLGYFFILDSGDKLLPTNSLDINQFEDSSRIIVTYSIESYTETLNVKTFIGEIAVIEGILTKDIIQLTEEIEDSLGNDLVFLYENSIWLSERHLNVIFNYYGYNHLHYINLAKPNGEQTDDEGNQILELRHNSNDDHKTYVYESVVSFSMDSLYKPGLDSINFVLQAIDGDTINHEFFGTFHFTDEQKNMSRVITPKAEYHRLIE